MDQAQSQACERALRLDTLFPFRAASGALSAARAAPTTAAAAAATISDVAITLLSRHPALTAIAELTDSFPGQPESPSRARARATGAGGLHGCAGAVDRVATPHATPPCGRCSEDAPRSRLFSAAAHAAIRVCTTSIIGGALGQPSSADPVEASQLQRSRVAIAAAAACASANGCARDRIGRKYTRCCQASSRADSATVAEHTPSAAVRGDFRGVLASRSSDLVASTLPARSARRICASYGDHADWSARCACGRSLADPSAGITATAAAAAEASGATNGCALRGHGSSRGGCDGDPCNTLCRDDSLCECACVGSIHWSAC